ncbi:MAG: sigma-54 interaction domain-containing protein [Planctomycetota bacterium]|jgi:transcriptional regulator with PAS, ATPase and Fis domain
MSESPLDSVIGGSSVMRALKSQIQQVAAAEFPVLILGESGAGKEVVAKAIHAISQRKEGPFVGQSCLAIPATLIESELFGYEPGAFTDARETRQGLFEQAEDGTLFLDEIGDIPMEFQKSLLRVLQEREIRRLGGTETIPVNVRIITATNAAIEQLVVDGGFRQDLLYRLNTFEINVPPLRNRLDDVPMLVHHFISKHGERFGIEPDPPSQFLLDQLKAYPWPGNVRELENFVVRWISLGDDALKALNKDFTLSLEKHGDNKRWLNMSMKEIEAEILQMFLVDCNGNKSLAAKRLGIARKSLYNKLERHGLA